MHNQLLLPQNNDNLIGTQFYIFIDNLTHQIFFQKKTYLMIMKKSMTT
jgi:hypothetical protein